MLKRKNCALLLVAVFILMLFLPFVSLTPNEKEEMGIVGASGRDISLIAEDAVNSLESYGLKIREKTAYRDFKKILNAMKDGAFSVLELRMISAKLSSYMKKLMDAVGNSYFGYYMLGSSGMDPDRIVATLMVVSMTLNLFFYGMIALMTWIAVGVFRDRRIKGSLIAAEIFAAILFLAVVICVIKVNLWSNDMMGYPLLRLTLWTFCMLLLPIAIGIVMWAEESTVGHVAAGMGGMEAVGKDIYSKVNIAVRSGVEKIGMMSKPWTCDCGRTNEASNKFCSGCGKAKPLAERCSSCGAPIVSKTNAFCSKCGQPIRPQKHCSRCGAVLREEERFCSRCGWGESDGSADRRSDSSGTTMKFGGFSSAGDL